MSKQPAFRLEAINYFLKGQAIPWAGDTLYISLHHTAPYSDDKQTRYEVSYPGYVRQPISAADWSRVGTTSHMTNNRQITFPSPNGGTPDEVWWVGLGTHETGDGQLLYYTNVFTEVFLIVLHEPVIIPVGGLTVRET